MSQAWPAAAGLCLEVASATLWNHAVGFPSVDTFAGSFHCCRPAEYERDECCVVVHGQVLAIVKIGPPDVEAAETNALELRIVRTAIQMLCKQLEVVCYL
jgi:hypothetical protein